jgi:hypothetical protein
MSNGSLGLRRDPFQLLFSRAPWAGAWYLLGYLFTGTVLFSVTLTAVLTAGVLGYFPNGPHGHGAWGLYVDTLPKAITVAAACLVLFLLFNYVVIAAARLHAAIARALLRAPEDPLRAAREVLLRPGPLSGTPHQI